MLKSGEVSKDRAMLPNDEWFWGLTLPFLDIRDLPSIACSASTLRIGIKSWCSRESELICSASNSRPGLASTSSPESEPDASNPILALLLSQQRNALYELYRSNNGVAWKRKGWLESDSLESWQGVGVSAHGLVVSLSLERSQMEGTIPFELGVLSRFDLTVYEEKKTCWQFLLFVSLAYVNNTPWAVCRISLCSAPSWKAVFRHRCAAFIVCSLFVLTILSSVGNFHQR